MEFLTGIFTLRYTDNADSSSAFGGGLRSPNASVLDFMSDSSTCAVI